jgi:hypothetical protein
MIYRHNESKPSSKTYKEREKAVGNQFHLMLEVLKQVWIDENSLYPWLKYQTTDFSAGPTFKSKQ